MSNLVFIDMASAQLPLPLSNHPQILKFDLLFVDMASAQLPLPLSNHPQILKFDLLFVDMASAQLPLQPTVHKTSCHKLKVFFLFDIIVSIY
jgi:hypothetical protein